MADQLALEMMQYAHPIDEVLPALEASFSGHKHVKRLKRDGYTLKFDFKIPIIASGGLSWILKAEPFLAGCVVTAFALKGMGYQATSAAADRLKVGPLLVAAAATLSGDPAGPSSPGLASGFMVSDDDVKQRALFALDRAEQCATRADVVGEELALWRAEDTVALAGKSVSEWLSAEKEARIAAGRLRTSVEVIGEIGEELTLMSDRILCTRRIKDLRERTVRPMHPDVTASVVNGSDTTSLAKPSLIRMAMRSVLPDTVSFLLSHPEWELAIPVDPSALDRVGDLAARVNGFTGTSTQNEAALSPASEASSTIPASITDQLRDLAALHREGVLTDDEFARAKAKLLEG